MPTTPTCCSCMWRSTSSAARLAAGLAALGLAALPAWPQGASSAAPAGASPALVGSPAPRQSAAAESASAGAVPAAPASAASASAAAPAPPAPGAAMAASLDARIQDTKAEVIRLNRDLLVLEEELLFPASTQVALFVSMDVGQLFQLESVQLLLDGQVVASHLYTPQQVQALHRGGVQRLHLGNLKTGTHELVAFFTGQGPHQRDYKRGTKLAFDKGTEPRYIELQIKDSPAKLQPEFEVKVWP